MGFCLEEKGGERREVWEDVSSNSYNQGSELFLKLLLTLWVVRWAHPPSISFLIVYKYGVHQEVQ